MRIGVPKEIKTHEYRVGLTPAAVREFTSRGHLVQVQQGAAAGIGFTDEAYRAAGARIADSAAEIFADAEMIVKVKEPQPDEIAMLREGQVLFTYLHLAADKAQTEGLMRSGATCIAYETVTDARGALPLLAPMSEVAGRLSVQVGAWCLQHQNGGRGVLLSGASGVRPGKVVILGAGIAGTSACQVAVGIGADVSILDVNPTRLRYVHDILGGHVTTVMSNRANIEEEALEADLVIGSVLIPGARAPKLLSRQVVAGMRKGAALVDISIDQGGTAETSRPTTHDDPIYVEEGVVHYCVTNMPGMVPHTSTHALTNVTLGYALQLADLGTDGALEESATLRRALNVRAGRIVHSAVAEAFPALALRKS